MNTITRILVPLDFQPHSAEAVRHAMDLARQCSAEVVLLHVYQPAEYPLSSNDVVYAPPQLERVTAGVRARLEAVRRDVDPRGRGGITTRVVQGTPARAIVQAASDERIDLIVMGTHGRTGVSRILLGSIAEDVMRRAPCAVLTVKSAREHTPRAHRAPELPKARRGARAARAVVH